MKSHLRVSLLFVLSFLLLLSTVSIAMGADTSGQCGDNAFWNFDENTNTLTISGSGAMSNYNLEKENTPGWYIYNYKITSVVVQEGITTVGNDAFYDLGKVTNVTLPSTLRTIGDNTFRLCFELKNITIPNGVESIGKCAFYCAGLDTIVVPDSVTSIGAQAFEYCSLESIILSKNITAIEDRLFAASSLLKIDIPEKVNSIGKEAFSAVRLDKLVIPQNVKNISKDAFNECNEISSILVAPGNKNYICENNFLMDKDKTVLLAFAKKAINDDCALPVGFQGEVELASLWSIKNLKSIQVPEGVTIVNNILHGEGISQDRNKFITMYFESAVPDISKWQYWDGDNSIAIKAVSSADGKIVENQPIKDDYLQLEIGDIYSAKEISTDSDIAIEEQTFYSNNKNIATVDDDGNVQTKNVGKVQIVNQVKYSNGETSTYVTLIQVNPQSGAADTKNEIPFNDTLLTQTNSSGIKIMLNGSSLAFNEAPYVTNGTTMVPMRVIFEALKAEVNYDAATQKITATKGDTVIELVLGQKSAKKNGQVINLDVAATTSNGTTMVPLRFVAEALNAQVDWDNATQTVIITLAE